MSSNRNALACLLALSAILAGCVGGKNTTTNGPADPGPDAPTVPIQAIAECDPICAEPTLAWSPTGALLVSNVFGELVRLRDGRLENVTPPSGATGRNDALLQTDAKGRIWFTAMEEPGEWNYQAVRVARTEDDGATWSLNERVPFGVAGEPTGETGLVDRQWLAFDPKGPMYLVCACPGPFAAQIRASTDDGKSWSDPRPVPFVGRFGPVGPAAVDAQGRVVIPYLTGSALLLDEPALGIAVAVSADKGLTWTTHVVTTGAPGTGPQCCAWPNIASGPDGTHVSWALADGAVWVASSTDAASWKAAKWDVGGSSRQSVHPWPILLPDGRLGLVWFEGADWKKAGVQVSVSRPADVASGAKPLTVRLAEGTSITDHPYAAVAPDGTLFVPYVDRDEGVSVATWAPSPVSLRRP